MAAEPNHAASTPIVFAVATGPERRACSDAFVVAAGSDSNDSHFLQTGTGPLNLDALTEQVTELRATGLISIGTAGGLSPHLLPGTLLIPKRILLGNGTVVPTDPDWHADIYQALNPHCPVDTGDLLTLNELVRRPEQKKSLYDKTQAIAIDMESGQLAQLAERIGVRFLALRAVMDSVDDEIPGAAAVSVNEQGDLALGTLLKYLLKNPGDIAGMITTARRFRVSARILRQACHLGRDALLLSR